MNVNFEKKGIEFKVEVRRGDIWVTSNGATARAEAYKSHRHDAWVYDITDTKFVKAIGAKGARIAVGHDSAKEVCEYIEEEKRQKQEEEKAQKEQEIADIKGGKKKIKATYHDGEYLGAYEVFGTEAELLEGLGLAKYVSGWGYKIDLELVEACGKEFTYASAVEYARPAKEAEEKKIAEKKADVEAKFAEAKETGKPVILYKFSTDCNDPREECSTDIITGYAMPDGSTKETRTHTY